LDIGAKWLLADLLDPSVSAADALRSSGTMIVGNFG
jgi:hypothetical protein